MMSPRSPGAEAGGRRLRQSVWRLVVFPAPTIVVISRACRRRRINPLRTARIAAKAIPQADLEFAPPERKSLNTYHRKSVPQYLRQSRLTMRYGTPVDAEILIAVFAWPFSRRFRKMARL
jgi:hypothetical protein